jgi:hypothetical protein
LKYSTSCNILNNNKQQTTNNKQQTTNNKQQATQKMSKIYRESTFDEKRVNWELHPVLVQYKLGFMAFPKFDGKKELIKMTMKTNIEEFIKQAQSPAGFGRIQQKKQKAKLIILFSRIMTTKYIIQKLYLMKVEKFSEELKQLFSDYKLYYEKTSEDEM